MAAGCVLVGIGFVGVVGVVLQVVHVIEVLIVGLNTADSTYTLSAAVD